MLQVNGVSIQSEGKLLKPIKNRVSLDASEMEILSDALIELCVSITNRAPIKDGRRRATTAETHRPVRPPPTAAPPRRLTAPPPHRPPPHRPPDSPVSAQRPFHKPCLFLVIADRRAGPANAKPRRRRHSHGSSRQSQQQIATKSDSDYRRGVNRDRTEVPGPALVLAGPAPTTTHRPAADQPCRPGASVGAARD